MAKVLIKSWIPNSDISFSNGYGATMLNGIMYIYSGSKLYKFDHINKMVIPVYNVSNRIVNITNNGTYIQFMTYDGNLNIRLSTYDPNTNVYNYNVDSYSFSGPTFKYYSNIISLNGKNYIKFCAKNSSGDNISYSFEIINNKLSGTSTVNTYTSYSNYYINDLTIGRTTRVDNKPTYSSAYKISGISSVTSYPLLNNINGNYTGFFYDGYYYVIYDGKMYRWNTNLTESVEVMDGITNIHNTRINTIFRIEDDFYLLGTGGYYKFSFIDYNLTYKISNNDGSKTFVTITGQSPIKTVRFNYDGSNEVGYVITTLTDTVTGSYTTDLIKDKKLSGFSSAPNSNIAVAKLNADYNVTIDTDFTFYEIQSTYRPPATTFDINLYQNSAEVTRVDKTNYLTSMGTLYGVLREECSIISPSITFKQTSVPTFNYVYIAAFGRYYFVTGITSVSKDIWRMSLSCDVLMTWKDNIRAFTAIIARQENSFNPLLIDSELPAQVNQNITVTEFPAGGFSTDSAISYPFILTVVGA